MRPPSTRSLTALLVFLALTVPFGIAAHLISELAGLGWHDDADVAFSARHAYLALLAIAALGTLVAVASTLPRSDRRRRVAELIDALPFRGRGPAFAALSLSVQFAFFAVTQLGEGCPLCGGDVLVGVLAALAATVLGSLALALGKRRFLELAGALLWFVVRGGVKVAPAAGRLRRSRTFTRRVRALPYAFRYRPPPLKPSLA